MQSPSLRQPEVHASSWVLQMLSSAHCSSTVQLVAEGTHLFEVMSQKVDGGQSRFEVHAASVWQNPRGLQKPPALQPTVEVQRQAPLTGSQIAPGPQAASLWQTHRWEPGSLT